MSKRRRHFSDSVKADAVRRHLSDKIPVSDLADELKVQPSLVYPWVKQVLDHTEKAFGRPKGRRGDGADKPREHSRVSGLAATISNASNLAKSHGFPVSGFTR